MSRLIFCFDGTWNGRDDKVPTNIRKLHLACNQPGQTSFYFAGPGNEDESTWLEEKLGGMFGWGMDNIQDQAIKTLRSVKRPGDTIVVFGFSRGAAIARMFCSLVAVNGVNGHNPGVEFLGCFDTVAAFLPFGPSQQGLFHDLHVHSSVQTVRHAVALDEDREAFRPNLMNKRDGIVEMWFKGVHSDIGGGFEDTGLSDRALGWMIQECAAMISPAFFLSWIRAQVGGDAPVGVNKGHWRTEPRRVGVMVDDEWSGLEPRIFRAS